MKNTRTCGEAIVALLEQYKVEVVFGIPGVHTLELYRGLVGSKIRPVLPRHEQGAGFMADGYARATGEPGVCFLITGPGLTNAATPIAQAYSDSVPMLVISSVNESRKLGRGMGELHEMPDQLRMSSAFTAFSARADRPEDFPELLAMAFDVFKGARPRPVHIEVPIDIFDKPVDEDWHPRQIRKREPAEAAAIAESVHLLGKGAMPLIIAGGGAKGGEKSIKAIAEKLGAPVVTTVAGSGLLPCSHPLSLGSTLVSPATHALISQADIVLAVGTELASTDTWGETYQFSGRLIRLDIDKTQFANGPRADLTLHGDARATLKLIAESLDEQASAERIAERGQEVGEALAAFDANLSAEENIRRHAFDAVVDALPPETLVACDMTQIGYTGHSVFRPEMSGRMLFPQGYGTLGYGLPAGLGAQLGAPQKPVVVFVGDGGLQYTMQEMATAAEEGLPVVLVLWNNGWLQQIREGFVDHGIEPIAVHPKNPDFQLLAKGFGWSTIQVTTLEGLGEIVAQTMNEARKNSTPAMIEILADAL